MSQTTFPPATGASAKPSYTITEHAGCTFVRGDVPISDLARLMRRAGRHAIIAPDLARLADAKMAWGLPAAVHALSTELRAKKLAQARAGKPMDGLGLSAQAQEWLLAGEHGVSSCSIFWRLTGVRPPLLRADRHYAHPRDPDDLRRCMLLLDEVPEFRDRIGEMRGASASWDVLVDAWDDLCASLEAEIPAWRDPPRGSAARKTYRAMQDLLDPVREAELERARHGQD